MLEHQSDDLLGYFQSMQIGDEEDRDKETLADLSDKYRLEGKKFYKKGDTIEAIKMYTKSIACAMNSKELAVSFANRSAALFKINRFEECLQEIDRALDNDYDKTALHKLYLRQARCLKLLGRDFEGSLKKCYKAIEYHLDHGDQIDLKKFTEEDIEKPPPKVDSRTGEFYQHMPVPPLSYEVNETVPGLSSAVSLEYSEELGRHLVAKRDIEIGDVVIVEKPFAAMINPDHAYLFCSKCFKLCFNLIPHKKRHRVLFCVDCSMESNTETDIQDERSQIGDSRQLVDKFLKDIDVFFGLRTNDFYALPDFATYVIKNVIGIDALINTIKSSKPDSENNQDNPDNRTMGFKDGKLSPNLDGVLSLCDNLDKLSSKEKDAITSFSSELALTFSTGADIEMESLVSLIAKLYLRVVFNYKHISIYCQNPMSPDSIDTGIKFVSWPSVNIGMGLYLSSSFLNHSCEPNLVKINYGAVVVYRAILPINEGQVLTESYSGVHRLKMELLPRRRLLLKHFRFVCKCEACLGNWQRDEQIVETIGDESRDPAFKFIVLQWIVHEVNKNIANYSEASLQCVNTRVQMDSGFVGMDKVDFWNKIVSDCCKTQNWTEISCEVMIARVGVTCNFLGQGSSFFSKFGRQLFTGEKTMIYPDSVLRTAPFQELVRAFKIEIECIPPLPLSLI